MPARKKNARRAKGTGALFKRGAVYYYRVIGPNGKKHVESLRVKKLDEALKKIEERQKVATARDEVEALQSIARVKELVHSDTVPLAEVWTRFLTTGPTCGPGTLSLHKGAWTRFLNWMDTNCPNVSDLADVDGSSVLRFLDETWASGISASRWNDIRTSCRMVHKAVAARHKGIAADVWPTGREARKREPQQEHKPLDAAQREELHRILDGLTLEHPEQWRVLFGLGLYAGMRLADAALCKAESVRGGWITYTPIKTERTSRAQAKVPILPQLAGMIEGLSEHGGEYLLPDIAEAYSQSPSRVKYHVQKIITESVGGVHHQKVKGQRIQQRALHGFHSLRTTFCTEMAKVGATPGQLKSMSGDHLATIDKYYAKAKNMSEPIEPAYRLSIAGEDGKESKYRERLRQLADELPITDVRQLLEIAEREPLRVLEAEA